MTMSIARLFRMGFQILFRDPAVIVPYLSFFILHLIAGEWLVMPTLGPLGQIGSSDILILSVSWVAETGIKLLTTGLALRYIFRRLWVDFPELKERLPVLEVRRLPILMLRKFPAIVAASALVLLPLFASVQGLSQVQSSPLSWVTGVYLLIGIMAIPLGVVLEFLPAILLVEDCGLFSGLIRSTQFVKQHLKACLLYFALVFSVMLAGSILGLLLGSGEYVGSGLLVAVSQGVTYALVYLITPIFYLLLRS